MVRYLLEIGKMRGPMVLLPSFTVRFTTRKNEIKYKFKKLKNCQFVSLDLFIFILQFLFFFFMRMADTTGNLARLTEFHSILFKFVDDSLI